MDVEAISSQHKRQQSPSSPVAFNEKTQDELYRYSPVSYCARINVENKPVKRFELFRMPTPSPPPSGIVLSQSGDIEPPRQITTQNQETTASGTSPPQILSQEPVLSTKSTSPKENSPRSHRTSGRSSPNNVTQSAPNTVQQSIEQQPLGEYLPPLEVDDACHIPRTDP